MGNVFIGECWKKLGVISMLWTTHQSNFKEVYFNYPRVIGVQKWPKS